MIKGLLRGKHVGLTTFHHLLRFPVAQAAFTPKTLANRHQLSVTCLAATEYCLNVTCCVVSTDLGSSTLATLNVSQY